MKRVFAFLILLLPLVSALPYCDEIGGTRTIPMMGKQLNFDVNLGGTLNIPTEESPFYFLPPSFNVESGNKCLLREPVSLYLRVMGPGKDFIKIPESVTVFDDFERVSFKISVPQDYVGGKDIPFFIWGFQDPQIPNCKLEHLNENGSVIEQPYLNCTVGVGGGKKDMWVWRKEGTIHTNSENETVILVPTPSLQSVTTKNYEPAKEAGGGSDYTLLIAVGVLAFVGVGYYVLRKKKEEEELNRLTRDD